MTARLKIATVDSEFQVADASEPEIEITPEMIEAGSRVLCERYGVAGKILAEGIVEDVFEAMLHSSNSSDLPRT